MRWVYIAASVVFYIKMLVLSDPVVTTAAISNFELVVEDTGVTNAVSGIIFRNRLYDTIYEVVVFTLAIMGVRFFLSDEKTSGEIY
ncbi:MAG: cation:proton antiporter, partial [Cyanobacteria bacterium P01_H01_bin.15]